MKPDLKPNTSRYSLKRLAFSYFILNAVWTANAQQSQGFINIQQQNINVQSNVSNLGNNFNDNVQQQLTRVVNNGRARNNNFNLSDNNNDKPNSSTKYTRSNPPTQQKVKRPAVNTLVKKPKSNDSHTTHHLASVSATVKASTKKPDNKPKIKESAKTNIRQQTTNEQQAKKTEQVINHPMPLNNVASVSALQTMLANNVVTEKSQKESPQIENKPIINERLNNDLNKEEINPPAFSTVQNIRVNNSFVSNATNRPVSKPAIKRENSFSSKKVSVHHKVKANRYKRSRFVYVLNRRVSKCFVTSKKVKIDPAACFAWKS